jgi:hypothetical protein
MPKQNVAHLVLMLIFGLGFIEFHNRYIIQRTNKMQLWQYCLLVTAKSLYMFRTLSASIIRSAKNCSSSHWCKPWVGMVYIQ